MTARESVDFLACLLNDLIWIGLLIVGILP